ncbi:unnamed protein product [Caenorhabditis auriculariae]|uniref:Uncharacterized protein n=1 Tax=Caenorhabditis auriculariae TaxID=2777116 RepID=A0A8S1HS47_9PELO|nr:unnamed protein product [Caenorhabditis auriculariae]
MNRSNKKAANENSKDRAKKSRETDKFNNEKSHEQQQQTFNEAPNGPGPPKLQGSAETIPSGRSKLLKNKKSVKQSIKKLHGVRSSERQSKPIGSKKEKKRGVPSATSVMPETEKIRTNEQNGVSKKDRNRKNRSSTAVAEKSDANKDNDASVLMDQNQVTMPISNVFTAPTLSPATTTINTNNPLSVALTGPSPGTLTALPPATSPASMTSTVPSVGKTTEMTVEKKEKTSAEKKDQARKDSGTKEKGKKEMSKELHKSSKTKQKIGDERRPENSNDDRAPGERHKKKPANRWQKKLQFLATIGNLREGDVYFPAISRMLRMDNAKTSSDRRWGEYTPEVLATYPPPVESRELLNNENDGKLFVMGNPFWIEKMKEIPTVKLISKVLLEEHDGRYVLTPALPPPEFDVYAPVEELVQHDKHFEEKLMVSNVIRTIKEFTHPPGTAAKETPEQPRKNSNPRAKPPILLQSEKAI